MSFFYYFYTSDMAINHSRIVGKAFIELVRDLCPCPVSGTLLHNNPHRGTTSKIMNDYSGEVRQHSQPPAV